MNETLNYIESYFENGLTAEERKQFEQRISADAAFAGEVAFYIQARQVLRQQLLEQKERSWKGFPAAEATPMPVMEAVEKNQKDSPFMVTTSAPVVPIKKATLVKRWLAVAAGVIVIVSISLTVLLKGSDNAVQMAQQYTDSAFESLSLSMGSQDSLQQGIDAYNHRRYSDAENIFTAVYTSHPTSLQALEYLGIVSLKKKDYDTAFARFGQLASHKELFVNSGTFYQAITLLLRNKKDDKEQARMLLQQVLASENSDNKDKAKQLLSSL